MQKISSYLYPNRIILLADLAGFTTEYTNVYQRIIKIYQGVDNVLEFDVKNADQKRIDISTLDNISVNLMDSAGNSIGIYTVTPFPQDSLKKGIGYTTIPSTALTGLDHQFLRYSVTHTVDDNPQVLYGDTRFGATGTIELLTNAMPVDRPARVFNSFTGEIDLNGYVMHRSSAIPAKFYEAVPTTQLTFELDFVDGFIGTVYIEGTKDMTISVNSFLHATKIQSHTFDVAFTGEYAFPVVDIGEFNYFRITWKWPDTHQYTSYVTDNGPGKLGKITVYYGNVVC
jgi:hypothetical protein